MNSRPFLYPFLLLSLVFVVGCQKTAVAPETTQADSQPITQAVIKTVSVNEAHTQLNQGTMLIDVRQPSELISDGAYPGATNMPLDLLSMEKLPSDKSTPIMFGCRSGNRSGRAAQLAIEWGYTNVFNVLGGINAWKSSGLPIE